MNRKTGSIRLTLAPQQRVTSARFVNELHPSNIVLAEISKPAICLGVRSVILTVLGNGVMHVLSGETHDPDGMRSISSFLALDVMRHNLACPPTARERGILSSSWWRQTGRLVVGGASEDINVWDCPAERCVKVSPRPRSNMASVLPRGKARTDTEIDSQDEIGLHDHSRHP